MGRNASKGNFIGRRCAGYASRIPSLCARLRNDGEEIRVRDIHGPRYYHFSNEDAMNVARQGFIIGYMLAEEILDNTEE